MSRTRPLHSRWPVPHNAMLVLAVVLSWPVTMYSPILMLECIRWVRGANEVAPYIESHESLVEKYRDHPHVQGFSVSVDPNNSAVILIQGTVTNHEVYQQIRHDFADAWSCHFDTRCQIQRTFPEKLDKFGSMSLAAFDVYRKIIVLASCFFLGFIAFCVTSIVAIFSWKKPDPYHLKIRE